MPVLKIKKDGVWEEIMGGSSSESFDGGNADTLDGKSAEYFASQESVSKLQQQVGDSPISDQIESMIKDKADSTHTHSEYAKETHTHSEYAKATHVHNVYAASDHKHSYNDLSDLPTSLPTNGGDADTLDGKHADDFVTKEYFNTQVGDETVSDQIGKAIKVLCIFVDDDNDTCSHSASEIISAIESGMIVVVNNDFDYVLAGYGDDWVDFVYQHMWDDMMYSEYVTINEDKSCDYGGITRTYALNVITVNDDNIASMNFDDITSLAFNDSIVVLRYNEHTYDFQYSYHEVETNKWYAYFISEQSNGDEKFTSVVTIDQNANVSEVKNVYQPIIPKPKDADIGKALVVGDDKKVSWKNVSASDSNGGDADTLGGYSADAFVKSERFSELVGDETVSDQIDKKIADKADANHTHDGYADQSHTHSEYAASDHAHTGYADSDHTHRYSDLTDLPDFSQTNGGDADTLDGKHAGDFVASSVFNDIVGDTAVSKQIENAIVGLADADHTHDDYVNQNTFSNVKVGNSQIAAASTTDTLTFVAGDNVTITPNTTNKTITIASAGTTYTHPNSTVMPGTYKSVTVDAQGHVTEGANPTTLEGYGITDAVSMAYFSEHVGDTKVSDQIDNKLANFSSGKTLSEHLTEEDMVLSSRQYGDVLPGEDGEPYTHVPGRIFFLSR